MKELDKKKLSNNQEIPDGYIPITEASKKSGVKRDRVNNLHYMKAVPSVKVEGRVYICYQKLIEYIANSPSRPKGNNAWKELDIIPGEAFYPIGGFDCKYFISNRGRLYNASNGTLCRTEASQKNGYTKIILMASGNKKTKYIHELVALTQCPNALRKNIVHHIIPHIPSIDTPDNLMFVTGKQHTALHELLRQGNMKKYHKMIEEVLKENSQKTYEIPHLDFEDSENFRYYMVVNQEGYDAYKLSGDVPARCILLERAEPREEAKLHN